MLMTAAVAGATRAAAELLARRVGQQEPDNDCHKDEAEDEQNDGAPEFRCQTWRFVLSLWRIGGAGAAAERSRPFRPRVTAGQRHCCFLFSSLSFDGIVI